MSNGGIIGPINDPTRTDQVTSFTASGTYTNPLAGPLQADYLVVAGGGGGGGGSPGGPSSGGGGGGGAGGYRTSFPGGTKLTLSCASYPVTVGAGGTGGTNPSNGLGGSGTDSIFSTITSAGGGGGAMRISPGGANAG
jgi:hypothetical protein